MYAYTFFEVHFHCFKYSKVSVAIGQSGAWFVVKYWYHCLFYFFFMFVPVMVPMYISPCVYCWYVCLNYLFLSLSACGPVSLSLWLRCVLVVCVRARGRTIIEIKRKEKTTQRVTVTQTSLKSCDVLFYLISSTPLSSSSSYSSSSSSSSPRITRSI